MPEYQHKKLPVLLSLTNMPLYGILFIVQKIKRKYIKVISLPEKNIRLQIIIESGGTVYDIITTMISDWYIWFQT